LRKHMESITTMECAGGCEQDRLWDRKDVATYLKVSQSWVYQKVAAGLLPCRRIGGLVRFLPEEIRAYAAGESTCPSQRTARA
jgi:excisionase family DNA binding protein